MQFFTNNAVGTLEDEIGDEDVTITMADTAWAHNFSISAESSDRYQLATITNQSQPDWFEIVRIVGFDSYALTLTIERAVEDTTARVWPAGSIISARVTAGMLEEFNKLGSYFSAHQWDGLLLMDNGDAGSSDPVGGGSLIVNLTNWRRLGNVWRIGGVPALQQLQDGGASASGLESIWTTDNVELGVAPLVLAETEYPHAAIVRNSAGKTYRLGAGYDGRTGMSGADESSLGYSPWPEVSSPGSGDGVVMSFMAAEDITLFPTEFGFICDRFDGVSTAPTVSIGTTDQWGGVLDAEAFGADIPLSGITGALQIQRIPVTTNFGVQGVVFKLTSPADGSFQGRFYCKGMFVESVQL